MTAPLDLSAPLYAPRFRVEPMRGGKLLLDTDNAHWIAVSEAGAAALTLARGRTAAEIATEFAPTVAGLERFLKQAHQREFLSNKPYLPMLYSGRSSSLKLDRLHEFWVVPNYDCNLRCRHCYTIEQVIGNPARLPGSTACAIIDDAKKLGTEIFYFTGGEVLQHPDIFEMIEHVTRDRKAIVFTNGMHIDDAVAARLARSRDRLIVQISIEGPDEASNRLIRGNLAFDPAWQGLINCLRHGVRVGVSSTPCKATAIELAKLTARLCTLNVDGRGVEYHHLIMLLDVGGVKKNASRTYLTSDEYTDVLNRCSDAAAQGRKEHGSRLVVANEKIHHACASNGPKKDFCGAGYTILGVDPEGNLKTCAATINDPKYHLGSLLQGDGSYILGTLEQHWRHGERTQWVRNFTLARRQGEPDDDLRFFHGGACWYNMTDPEGPLSTSHPFYKSLEDSTLAAIRAEAEKRSTGVIDGFALRAYMHRSRIACAGSRKTVDESPSGLDIGYCICFA